MNLRRDGVVHAQVDVPTRCPVQLVVFLPCDIVRKQGWARSNLSLAIGSSNHGVVGVNLGATRGITRGDGVVDLGNLVIGSICAIIVTVKVVVVFQGFKVVLDREGLDSETNNTVLVGFSLDRMVHNLDIDMIVHVRLFGVGCNKANGESLPISCGDGSIILNLAGSRQVVDNPIVVILLSDCPNNLVGRNTALLTSTEVGRTELLAVHFFLHV
mmetsp:Transcript_7751/g.11296  ORF Transcript_7751/g.11296 Transcript_7751/m.11296 type:complete len:214 (-) Transcript_7751:342-983(-)